MRSIRQGAKAALRQAGRVAAAMAALLAAAAALAWAPQRGQPPAAATPTPLPAVDLLELLYPGQALVPPARVSESPTTRTEPTRRTELPSTGTLRVPLRIVRLSTSTEVVPPLPPVILGPPVGAEDDRASTLPAVTLTLEGSTSGTTPAVTSPTLPRVRVNHADQAELMNRLKIDARRARLIIEFRTLYGPFRRPEDLTQVTGLSDWLVRQWESSGLLDFE